MEQEPGKPRTVMLALDGREGEDLKEFLNEVTQESTDSDRESVIFTVDLPASHDDTKRPILREAGFKFVRLDKDDKDNLIWSFEFPA